MFEVLYSTGIRRSELNNICVNDVDYTEGYIRINDGKTCQYLFISKSGQKLSINILARLLEKYAKKAKLKKRVTPHIFRHTCATLMLKNKANIRHIQEMLGHKSLNSTQMYTHLTITDLKQVHKKCHPREADPE